MAIQTINVGTGPNTGNGDTLRAAMQKTNENFSQVISVPPSGEIVGKEFHVRSFGAIPNDGQCDIVAIQAAIEAASVDGGTVIFEAGVYDLDPNNMVYPSRTSEGHPSCLTIWANNVRLVGAGSRSTILRVKNDRAGGIRTNLLGSGSATGPVGFSGVVISGLCLDANFFNAECTQIYNAVNWTVQNVGVRNTQLGCDGFDFQGGSGIRLFDVFAEDIADNALGTQDENLIVDGFKVLRCGSTGGFGSAFQFNVGAPRLRRVVAIDCPHLMTPNTSCWFEDSYLHSNNSSASYNHFVFSPGTGGTFTNVTISVPAVGTGAVISIAGGGIIAKGLTIDNTKVCINMSSGTCHVEDSYLGISGTAMPIVTSGGTNLHLYRNTIRNAGSGDRDVRLQTGGITTVSVIGNQFLGTEGFLMNNAAFANVAFENNFVAGNMYVSVASTGCRFKNNRVNGLLINAGGNPVYESNYFANYRRDGGTPVFINNVFATAANTSEVQESVRAFTAITPTTTTTTYTNNNPFAVLVFFRGGAIESASINGTQVYGTSTNGNCVELAFGDTLSLDNSNITGMVVNWLQKR